MDLLFPLSGLLMTLIQKVLLSLLSIHLCQEPYSIKDRVELISEESFTPDFLRSYFLRELRSDTSSELEIKLLSPTIWTEYVERSKPRPRSPHKPPSIEPIKMMSPMARLYRIGPNAFYEFRDPQGAVRWETAQGENLFSRIVGHMSVWLVGQTWAVRVGKDTDATRRRDLSFVVPDLNKENIDAISQIVAFYDSVLVCPSDLGIELFGSIEDATANNKLLLPSVQAQAVWPKQTPAAPKMTVIYMRITNSLGKNPMRLIRIYEGERLVYFDDAVKFK